MDGATMKTETFDSVWDALADNEQEAEELKVRSAVFYELRIIVKGWKLSHEKSAVRLGVTIARLEELLAGKLSAFSQEDLLEIASAAKVPATLALNGARQTSVLT